MLKLKKIVQNLAAKAISLVETKNRAKGEQTLDLPKFQ